MKNFPYGLAADVFISALFTAFLLTLVSLMINHAFAAGAEALPAGYEVDVRAALDALLTLVFTILSGIAAAILTGLIAVAKKKFGIEIDAKVRGYLEMAILNGINLAEQRTRALAADVHPVKVKHEIIAYAATYVMRRVPDAIQHFKLDAHDIQEMIEARLSQNVLIQPEQEKVVS